MLLKMPIIPGGAGTLLHKLNTTYQQKQYCKHSLEHDFFFQLKSPESSLSGFPKKLIV